MKLLMSAAFAAGMLCAVTTEAAPLEPGDYKVGFVAEITGPIAFAGTSFLHGAQLAAAEISAGGLMGAGTTITLVEKDGASDAARSIQNINQFVADRTILATTCCILSPVANAIKPIVAAAKIPLVIYGATLPGLPAPPWTYSVTVLPGPKDTATAVKVTSAVKPKTAAYFVSGDNDALKGRMLATQKTLEASGIATVGVVSVLNADTDFTPAATQAMGLKPDAILIYATQGPTVGVIATLKQRGYAGVIVGNDVLAPDTVFKKLGAAVAGIAFPISFSPDLATNEAARKFVAAYQAKFGAAPDIYSAQGYAAIAFIAQGLKAAGGRPTREGLAGELAKQKEIEMNVYGGEPMTDGQAETRETLVVAWSPEGKIIPWAP